MGKQSGKGVQSTLEFIPYLELWKLLYTHILQGDHHLFLLASMEIRKLQWSYTKERARLTSTLWLLCTTLVNQPVKPVYGCFQPLGSTNESGPKIGACGNTIRPIIYKKIGSDASVHFKK